MSFFTESQVRQKASEAKRYKTLSTEKLLIESSEKFKSSDKNYDIFLSHSKLDEELVLGIKISLEDMGYSVYIDWMEDQHLERDKVTKNTAQILKDRINNAKSLLFVTTENSETSKWMPWELGYFDGYKGKVAILPIKKNATDTEYKGQEYLGLYPYITKQNADNKLLLNSKKNIDLDIASFRDFLNYTEKLDFNNWIK